MEKQSTDQYDRHSQGEASCEQDTREVAEARKPKAARPTKRRDTEALVYFFPDQKVTEQKVEHILQHGSVEERSWVISHLLRYAQWNDIWGYVTREEVREIFLQLDLPASLRVAWGRMLKVEVVVG